MALLANGPSQRSRSVFIFDPTTYTDTISGTDSRGFTLAYTVGEGFLTVIVNGDVLDPTLVQATDGSTIKLLDGMLVGPSDRVHIVAEATDPIANSYLKSEVYTKPEADTLLGAKLNKVDPAYTGILTNDDKHPRGKFYRNVGWETLTNGNAYGIYGTGAEVVGSWPATSTVGASGSGVTIPKTGRYLIMHRLYASAASPGGRVNLTSSTGPATLAFCHISPISGGNDHTYSHVTVQNLVQGAYIYYTISSANVTIYTGSGYHTMVELYFLG